MSGRKYVPDRLRGVLGDDNAASSGRVSSSRKKGRKARPWRVDAASWKQQLQERKAVYDNFALQEKAEEEKETSSQIPEKEEFESIPLNVLTSTTDGDGGRVDTMLTPKGGGQVETVFTSPTTPTKSPTLKSASSSSSSSLVGNDQKINNSNDDYDTTTQENHRSGNSSRSSSSSPSKKGAPRRPSPLPRNRSVVKKRKGKKSSSMSSSYNTDSSDDGSEDWINDEDVVSLKSAGSNVSKEYYVDIASKDSNVAIVNGVAHEKKPIMKNKIFKPRSRVRMLRHGDSDDTAESIGLPDGEGRESSSGYPVVNKSSMMEAVENFIDPSRIGAGAEIIIRESPTRRGGRRRQRPPQLSPATSTTSITGTIMGNFAYDNATSSNIDGNNESYVRNDIVIGGDDEWSITPVPSEEEICLERRRWPLHPDIDTGTVSSGDTDMNSVNTNDVEFIPRRSDGENDMALRERIALSLSPPKRSDKGVEMSSSTEEIQSETQSTTGATPDPLQRARKTLLLSNLNRSVRSLDIPSHSKQDNDTVGDSSIESSYSTSIFVPLRSHQRSSSSGGSAKEIPLNVLDNHGVYVSKDCEKGIFVPLKNDLEQAVTEVSKKDNARDMFNDHGAYVPRDKAASLLDGVLQNDKIDSSQMEKTANNSQEGIEFGGTDDKEIFEDTSGVEGVPASNEEFIHVSSEIEHEDLVESENDGVGKQSEGKESSSQEQLQAELTSSKSNDGSKTLHQEGASPVENTAEDDAIQFKSNSDDDNKLMTIECDSDQKCSSSEHQIADSNDINDGGDDYGDCVVDEIDASRIRLISDLKRHVSSIYIENHVCVESVGTSEDPDPLETLRRKRAPIKITHNTHLKAQLNDTVSALNTDHHHVIESPGKMTSGKGKKWKERVAMKKLSKKNSTNEKQEEKSSLPRIESLGDNSTDEESSKAIESQENICTSTSVCEEFNGETEKTGGQNPVVDLWKTDGIDSTGVQDMAEDMEIANANRTTKEIDIAAQDISSATSEVMRETSEETKDVSAASTSSTLDDIRPVAKENSAQNNEDSRSLSEVLKSTSVDLMPEKLTGVNSDSMDNGPNVVGITGVPQERNAVSTLPNPTISKDTNTSTTDTDSENIAFMISEESEGNDTDLPISVNDSNIIQGLPPNKGKKWKDRLKKKKNKKSEKAGVAGKDDSESGDGTSKSIGNTTSHNTQETALVSASKSHDEASTNDNSKARPAYHRNLSDLTAEEKQRAVSPTNETKTEQPPKNVGKKSNKWKNRLAKMKGSKEDNTKSIQDNVPDGMKLESPSEALGACQILVDFKSPDTSPVVKKELAISDRDQILVDFKRSPEVSQAETSEPTNHQPFMGAPKTPDYLSKTDITTPTEASSRPSLSEKEIPEVQNQKLKTQDPNLHQNLLQSFDVFDSFLQKGHTDPVDDESLYTEMTIGQETLLQSDQPVTQSSEEELSYMDFTIEESVQPSFLENNSASKTGRKGQIMSPFMSNLLSSRMFQDDGPSIPMMPLPSKEPQQENEMKSKMIDSPDENLKQYPTITLGNDFDDDMTQITMGSLEDQNKESVEEEFFDAESNPISPSSKGKRSLNSRKSEGASLNSSTLPCSEVSKQRIVEILRKEVWSRDNKVVQSAMEELDAEAKNGHHHRAHIVRCGGVMTVMRAMEMNSNSEDIQIPSCSTLGKLALEPQTQITICEMEGISLIVRSMKINIDNVDLQEAACTALATICRHHEGTISKDWMKDADEAVPTLLSCMTRYPTNSCIQAKGFQAIANLCSESHAHQRLKELSKAGGIMTLTMALQTSWENKNDQHEAISNLSILLRGITELNEKSSLLPTRDSLSRDIKQDEINGIRNGTKSTVHEEAYNGEPLTDNESVISYMDEIPNMPMMSTTSLHCDEIPDLDDYGEEMSNLEWQNFGENDLDAGRIMSNDPTSPSNVEGQQAGADDTQSTGEEKCTIQ